LRHEIRDFRQSMERDFSRTVDHAVSDIAKGIVDSFSRGETAELIARTVGSVLSDEHFHELKTATYENKVLIAYRVLQNIMHIVKSPLSGMQLLVDDLVDTDTEVKNATNVGEQLKGYIGMLRNNLNAFGGQENVRDFGDNTPTELSDRVSRDIQLLLLTSDKKLELDMSGFPTVRLNAHTSENVMLIIACIVENAMAFALDNSRIIITCTLDDDMYTITITNSGSVIDEEMRKRIFEEGFSTRESMGVGLHLAKSVVGRFSRWDVGYSNVDEPKGVSFYLTFKEVPT